MIVWFWLCGLANHAQKSFVFCRVVTFRTWSIGSSVFFTDWHVRWVCLVLQLPLVKFNLTRLNVFFFFWWWGFWFWLCLSPCFTIWDNAKLVTHLEIFVLVLLVLPCCLASCVRFLNEAVFYLCLVGCLEGLISGAWKWFWSFSVHALGGSEFLLCWLVFWMV